MVKDQTISQKSSESVNKENLISKDDDINCPLCGEEVGFYGDDYEDVEIECSNVDCSLWAKNFTLSGFRTLLSQISRIRQEAKQEVFDDVEEVSTSYYSGYLKGCRRYFISKFEEIKKKHGVE